MLISLALIEDNNDRQFMSELYEQYKRLMYSKAMEFLANPQDVDDLIQDCLERLIINISTLRTLDGCKLASYIVVTVRNAAINLVKHQEVQSRHSFLTDFENDDPQDSTIMPEDLLLTKELSTEFTKVFDLLSENDRFLLRGKYILDLSDEELADTLGCAVNSVRMKLTRARRRAMRRLLEGDYFSEQT